MTVEEEETAPGSTSEAGSAGAELDPFGLDALMEQPAKPKK